MYLFPNATYKLLSWILNQTPVVTAGILEVPSPRIASVSSFVEWDNTFPLGYLPSTPSISFLVDGQPVCVDSVGWEGDR